MVWEIGIVQVVFVGESRVEILIQRLDFQTHITAQSGLGCDTCIKTIPGFAIEGCLREGNIAVC